MTIMFHNGFTQTSQNLSLSIQATCITTCQPHADLWQDEMKKVLLSHTNNSKLIF